MRRSFPLLAASLALAALTGLALMSGPPSAQAAKPTTTTSPIPTTTAGNVQDFTVNPLGDYTSPATANISGTATCTDPTGFGTLTFTNPTGTPYVIVGETQVVCDGQPHAWAATITSPSGSFVPGQAYLVQATLVAGGTTTGPATFKVVLR
jgi:hypothetical protein